MLLEPGDDGAGSHKVVPGDGLRKTDIAGTR